MLFILRLAFLTLSWMVFLFSYAPLSVVFAATEYEAQLDQARAQIGRGEAELAVETVRSVLEIQPNNGDALVALGVALHTIGQVQAGLDAYEAAQKIIGKQGFLLANMGRALWQLQRHNEAVDVLELAVGRYGEGQSVRALNSLGLAYHGAGAEDKALETYALALSIDPTYNNGELQYNMGVSLSRVGRAQDAVERFQAALGINPDYSEAMMNLAALLHEHQLLDRAVHFYRRVLSLPKQHVSPEVRAMAHSNLATALVELGDSLGAIEILKQELARVRTERLAIEIDESNGNGHSATADISLMTLLVKARRVICDWTDYAEDLYWLLQNVKTRQLDIGSAPSLLPFDSLLLAIPAQQRRDLAVAHAKQFETSLHTPPRYDPSILTQTTTEDKHFPTLHVGYLSYDYGNHPTAHLAEALFRQRNASRFVVSALSYGKNDMSEYREQIQQHSDHFIEMASMSYEESIQQIADVSKVHIIMDMQGFTRGGRPQICAARPAPLIVNYLVFPGTQGASFCDYFVADSEIIPPEDAKMTFLEKIIYMPGSYQVNFFDNTTDLRQTVGHTLGSTISSTSLELEYDELLTDASVLCADENNAPRGIGEWEGNLIAASALCDKSSSIVPTKQDDIHANTDDVNKQKRPFIFCNFNKNDKLDPSTFATWLRILKRVPRSLLWLLEPTRGEAGKAMKRNLASAAQNAFVDPSRIVYAPRVPKFRHLARHRYADLFIDSLVYGAHSTATDALRGGLPVLTVRGDSVPNRVAVSLLTNLECPEAAALVVEDLMAFEDTAVRLANSTNRAVLTRIRSALLNSARTSRLFDSREHTSELEAGLRAIWDLKRTGLGTRHVILCRHGRKRPRS